MNKKAIVGIIVIILLVIMGWYFYEKSNIVCLDGSSSWYFEKRYISLGDNELFDKVIARSKICDETIYDVNVGGQFRQVTKGKFDQFLLDYNLRCENCLSYVVREGGVNINYFNYITGDKISTTTPIIGGDKDAGGCLVGAGYSWCEVKNKCLRVWEEKCESTPVSTTTKPVACTMDAMMCPDGTYVGRSAPDCKFICPTTLQKEIKIFGRLDKTIIDSFGSNYFKVRDINGDIYKLIYDKDTVQDYYRVGENTPYQNGSFAVWLKSANSCWAGITPEGAISLEHADLLCSGAMKAYFAGTDVGSKTIYLKKIITETN
jgi:hypothetical protein